MTGVCFQNQKYQNSLKLSTTKLPKWLCSRKQVWGKKKTLEEENEKPQTKEETGKPHNIRQTGSRLEIRRYQETSFAFCHWRQQQQQPCASSAPKAFHSRLLRSKCEDDLRNDCRKSKLLQSRNPLEIRCPRAY